MLVLLLNRHDQNRMRSAGGLVRIGRLRRSPLISREQKLHDLSAVLDLILGDTSYLNSPLRIISQLEISVLRIQNQQVSDNLIINLHIRDGYRIDFVSVLAYIPE